jgi:class 3 adenylate cyclase/tetratricopeptide (TPR) repeat protein
MTELSSLDESPILTLDNFRPRLQTLLPVELMTRLGREIKAETEWPEFVDLLAEVLETLQALDNNLSTYLPRSLILSRPTPGVPRSEFIEGTVLFLDVTGFTPLAERLRALGEEGAERLNRMISDLFTALLDPLSRFGGELLIFAGDAVQAYFPASKDAQDAFRATRAALQMIQAVEPFDQGSNALSAGIGLARGSFFAAQVGTAERMEYLVTGGPIQQAMLAEKKAPPRQICLAPGLESVLGSQFELDPCEDGFHLVIRDRTSTVSRSGPRPGISPDQRQGHRVVLQDRDPAVLVQAIEATLNAIEAMLPFFPPDVLRRILVHQRERQFPGEHRLVAVMFVNLQGFEELVAELGSDELAFLTYWINRYFIEARETLAGCGGLVTHVDPYEQGFTLLCPFGAPLADEDTPHRAAAAALRLNERLRLLNEDLGRDLARHLQSPVRGSQNPSPVERPLVHHHIGITYGPIYTGQVGWQERREYVVVGDEVNLSARLMSQARANQILISGWVHDRVRQSFECHPLEAMTLKGKTKPVTVYAVNRRVPASAWLREAAVGPLIGRDREMASLEDAMDALEKGRGGVLTLAGETGMGKTRLVAELALRARYWNVLLLAGRCLSYAQSNPYTPWIEALWRWFELDTAADKVERRSRVRQTLERFGLLQLEVTFWSLLGLPPSESPSPPRLPYPRPQRHRDLYSVLQERIGHGTPAYQDLLLTLAWRMAERDPALAANIPSMWGQLGQRIHPGQALLTLLKEIARQEMPVVFLVEDLQWSDRASWTSLVNLAQVASQYPILLLVTTRPGDTEKEWLAQIAGQCLFLAGLDWGATGRLATRLIMAREASDELISWLHDRARGNPLFISQLLYALAGVDGLNTDRETGRVTLSKTLPSLPLTVREIMLSRVDQLSEEARNVVKLVSVIGDSVSWDLLAHLASYASIASGASGERLLELVTELADQSLLTPRPPASEFALVHPLLKEAVYSSVPYVQRRKWHRSIADYLAQGDVEAKHQRCEALAYHYRNSDAPRLGVCYIRLAGDKARAREAWDEAVEYYRAAIEVIAEDPTLREERASNYERLGDVYALTGLYEPATAAYEAAQGLVSSAGRLDGKLGLILPLLGGADNGIQRLIRAWAEMNADCTLRPWVAAALGWLALRGQPRDVAAVAGSGAAAVAWWQRGQRIASTETVRVALKEMMAGRVPNEYSQLVRLALDDTAEEEMS